MGERTAVTAKEETPQDTEAAERARASMIRRRGDRAKFMAAIQELLM